MGRLNHGQVPYEFERGERNELTDMAGRSGKRRNMRWEKPEPV
jgi:hypothetical protein